ncbi:NAD-dependent epimerase/dehydratase family protein [Rhizorhabdus argentea]|uniref:NAD-dependent epimerase/dehydratase family protein n=1 Tax=Rhizorhabdus argentea TaxID=1387174 RepID=UPI0030ECE349
MRVLVVGGAGFVGSHLVRRCVAEGHHVDVVARPSSDISRLTPVLASIGLHRLSLLDAAAVGQCLAETRPTHIFYLVGATKRRHEPGVAQAALEEATGFLTLAQESGRATSRIRCFVRTGSIAEYGVARVPFREGQREHPDNGYAAAIVAGTYYAQALAPQLPFPLITARLALVYGPGQAPDFLVPSLVASCTSGQPIKLGRPLDRRDLIHVSDAVDALYRMATAGLPGGEIVNVGSGEAVGVAELAAIVAALAGADSKLVQCSAQSDPVTLQLSSKRAEQLMGWRPRIDIVSGIKGLIAECRRGARVAAA